MRTRRILLLSVPADPERQRELLREARLMLLFTPQLCGERDPQLVLDAVLPHVDVVQVRPKPLDSSAGSTLAREAYDWSQRVLAAARRSATCEVLVIVNDRVDVALALAGDGLAGVHLGQGDLHSADARALLGPGALIGLSTHDMAQVALGSEQAVDYLGFGPVFPSATKGYASGVGPERAWVAAGATDKPLFPIGGIDRENVGQLGEVRRAAVGSAILAAADPARAASELRALLGGPA